MKSNFILSAIISLCCLQIQAQQTKALTFKEAIELSIKNSKQLKANKAEIDIATASYKEALNNRLPNFNVSGSYLRLANPNINLKIKSNNNTASTTNSSPKVSQALYGIASLSYPIYAGGRIKYGIASAKYLEQAAMLDADNNKEAIILNTIDAFSNLYKSKATINLINENLIASRHRDTTFSNLEKNGLLARNDLLKAELQTSNIELSLLDAENNWQLANINMNLMLGLPENTVITPDSASMQQNISIKNIDEYKMLALQNRKDVQALSFRKKAVATSIKSANAQAYPTIALTAGYIAAYVPNVITITNAINIGIGVQYNLASLWKTNTKLLQAKATQQEIQANEDQLNDAVRLRVNRDYRNFLLSQKKIDVYTKAVYQASENYRITKNKYDNNLVNTTDLLDADQALLQARLNLAFGKVDVVTAYNKLLQTAGVLNQ